MGIHLRTFAMGLVFLLAISFPLAAVQMAGTWTLRAISAKGEVELTFHATDQGQNSTDATQQLEAGKLHGLSAEQIESTTTRLVRFSLSRAAGTFEFRGYLKQGTGAGTFVFHSSSNFIPAMQALGISGIAENDLLPMAIIDLSPTYVRHMQASGVDVRTAAELLEMRTFGVNGQYVRQLDAFGYSVREPDELVKLRVFKVDKTDVQGFRAAGYHPTVEELVQAKVFHVTPEFAVRLKELGYNDISMSDIVRLRMFGVTPEYARSMQWREGKHLTVDQLVRMRMFGID